MVATQSCGPWRAATAPACAKAQAQATFVLVDPVHGLNEGLWRGRVPQSPASHRERLGKPIDGDGAFAHPREARQADVHPVVVDDPLVDLIRDDQEIALND